MIPARNLAGEKVRVVHIPETFGREPGQVPDSPIGAPLVEESLGEITRAGIKGSSAAYDAHRSRRVATATLNEAAESQATLIVIGSRGLFDPIDLVVASTTRKVLHLGSLPVLVVAWVDDLERHEWLAQSPAAERTDSLSRAC